MLRVWWFQQLGRYRMTTDLDDETIIQVWREEGDSISGAARKRVHVRFIWDPVCNLGEGEEWTE